MDVDGIFRRRHLPHWDVPGATYFVTTCLHGSIPAQGLLDINNYCDHLARRPRAPDLSEDEWKVRQWKLGFARADSWLDQRPAVKHLSDAGLAAIVTDSLYHFADQRYELLAYVVMPSHLHWVFRPLENWVESLNAGAERRTPRERIMHSLKRHTGLACNRLLDCEGAFWQAESYDHWVRDAEELERVIDYVEQNPVKAGLVSDRGEWAFSSAKDRLATGVSLGLPLPRRRSGFQPDHPDQVRLKT